MSKQGTMGNRDKEPVTRAELKSVLGQITENMNQMSKYLLEDVNTMFRNYVYPNKIRLQAIEELVIERMNGDTFNPKLTKEDIDARAKKIFEDAVKSAKEMTEKGEIQFESEEQAEAEKSSSPNLHIVKDSEDSEGCGEGEEK